MQRERVMHIRLNGMQFTELGALREVATFEDQLRPIERPQFDADRWTAIQVDRDVDYVPATLETVGGRIAPPAGEVQPHRRARPKVHTRTQARCVASGMARSRCSQRRRRDELCT